MPLKQKKMTRYEKNQWGQTRILKHITIHKKLKR